MAGLTMNVSSARNMRTHVDKLLHSRRKQNYWVPDYAAKPWRMALMAGHNPANWRADRSRRGVKIGVVDKVEMVVAMTPDMSQLPRCRVTSCYRSRITMKLQDMTMEGRTPYIQVIDAAVPPLGESQV